MNLASKKAIQNLLKKYQVRPPERQRRGKKRVYSLRPLKRLGQNFLIDKRVIKKVIEAVNLKPKDFILEIGPGIGNITQELAKKVKKVIAVEKDQKMVKILKETLKDYENVEIIQADILKISNFQLPSETAKVEKKRSSSTSISNYKIVGNLPFYLTAPVIRKFLEDVEVKPRQMTLVVQKEVGQRICAKSPGQRDKSLLHPSLRLGKMSILAVSVQFYAKPEIISYVSKKSFWPQPKVDSAIIRITPRRFQVPVSPQFRKRFFKIVKAGFSQPRKQLINNLSKSFLPTGRQGKFNRERVKDWLLKNNIRPNQRAETLTIEDWISLTKNFNSMVK